MFDGKSGMIYRLLLLSPNMEVEDHRQNVIEPKGESSRMPKNGIICIREERSPTWK